MAEGISVTALTARRKKQLISWWLGALGALCAALITYVAKPNHAHLYEQALLELKVLQQQPSEGFLQYCQKASNPPEKQQLIQWIKKSAPTLNWSTDLITNYIFVCPYPVNVKTLGDVLDQLRAPTTFIAIQPFSDLGIYLADDLTPDSLEARLRRIESREGRESIGASNLDVIKGGAQVYRLNVMLQTKEPPNLASGDYVVLDVRPDRIRQDVYVPAFLEVGVAGLGLVPVKSEFGLRTTFPQRYVNYWGFFKPVLDTLTDYDYIGSSSMQNIFPAIALVESDIRGRSLSEAEVKLTALADDADTLVEAFGVKLGGRTGVYGAISGLALLALIGGIFLRTHSALMKIGDFPTPFGALSPRAFSLAYVSLTVLLPGASIAGVAIRVFRAKPDVSLVACAVIVMLVAVCLWAWAAVRAIIKNSVGDRSGA